MRLFGLVPACLGWCALCGGLFPDTPPVRLPEPFLVRNSDWIMLFARTTDLHSTQPFQVAFEKLAGFKEERRHTLLNVYQLVPACELSPSTDTRCRQSVTITVHGDPRSPSWMAQTGVDIQLFGYPGSPASFPSLAPLRLWSTDMEGDFPGAGQVISRHDWILPGEGLYLASQIGERSQPLFVSRKAKPGLPVLREGLYVLVLRTTEELDEHEPLFLVMIPERDDHPPLAEVYRLVNDELWLVDNPFLRLRMELQPLLDPSLVGCP